MWKRLTSLIGAVVVLAFAVPAVASASTGLTRPANTLVPVGTNLSLKSSSLTLTSSKLGEITCTGVSVVNKVTKNNQTEGFETEGSAESPWTNCTAHGKPVGRMKAFLRRLKSAAVLAGKVSAVIIAVFELVEQTCNYTGTEVQGTYASGTSSISFTEAPLTVTSGTNCGTSTFDTQFSVSLYGGGAAIIIM